MSHGAEVSGRAAEESEGCQEAPCHVVDMRVSDTSDTMHACYHGQGHGSGESTEDGRWQSNGDRRGHPTRC